MTGRPRKEEIEEVRLEGFHACRDGYYHPEAYVGWALDAYRLGRDDWVDLMATER